MFLYYYLCRVIVFILQKLNRKYLFVPFNNRLHVSEPKVIYDLNQNKKKNKKKKKVIYDLLSKIINIHIVDIKF